MRVVCNKEGDGDGGNSNGNKGVVQQRGRWLGWEIHSEFCGIPQLI
jgi:hypothetical protein